MIREEIVQLPQDVILKDSYVKMLIQLDQVMTMMMKLIQIDQVITMRMKQKMHQDMTAQLVN